MTSGLSTTSLRTSGSFRTSSAGADVQDDGSGGADQEVGGGGTMLTLRIDGGAMAVDALACGTETGSETSAMANGSGTGSGPA